MKLGGLFGGTRSVPLREVAVDRPRSHVDVDESVIQPKPADIDFACLEKLERNLVNLAGCYVCHRNVCSSSSAML